MTHQNQQIKGKITTKLLLYLLITVLLGASVIVLGFLSIRTYGKSSLYGTKDCKQYSTAARNQQHMITEKDSKEGWIEYEDQLYAYDENILTFLIMGIDEEGTVQPASNMTQAGQSDVMYVVVCNPSTNDISIIMIDRNTMTDIAVYNESGDYIGFMEGQIALQHEYGDGMELSCERSVEATSKLLYQVPIHGYVAINMGAIPMLNELLESMTIDKLSANMASELEEETYLTSILTELFAIAREDVSSIATIYQSLAQYMVTDISIDELLYLTSTFIAAEVSQQHIYELEGTIVEAGQYDEIYLDQDSLYELVMEVFYDEVTNPKYGY